MLAIVGCATVLRLRQKPHILKPGQKKRVSEKTIFQLFGFTFYSNRASQGTRSSVHRQRSSQSVCPPELYNSSSGLTRER